MNYRVNVSCRGWKAGQVVDLDDTSGYETLVERGWLVAVDEPDPVVVTGKWESWSDERAGPEQYEPDPNLADDDDE